MSNKKELRHKFLLWFWGVAAAPFVLLLLIFSFIGLGVFGPLPTFEQLENPSSNLATEIISEDGQLLGTFYVQNRSFVSYDEISPNLIGALLSTEDVRFYKHSGIDFRGLARVFVKTIMMGNVSQGGGSTISQQLAKQLFPRDTSSRSGIIRKANLVVTKFKEWIVAVKLERNYTKEEILAMYLNMVPFGNNAWGVKTAAKIYFDKSPADLTAEESALLVGMLNAPSRYNPIRHEERATAKRNFVLEKMYSNDLLNREQYDSLCALPIKLKFSPMDNTGGIAPYFREMLRIILTAKKPNSSDYWDQEQYKEDLERWESDPLYGWCNKNLKPDGTPYNIYKDGLKIYTTVNSRIQKYAEESLKDHMAQTVQKDFDAQQKRTNYRIYSNDIDAEKAKQLLANAVKQTERYRNLRDAGASQEEIDNSFNTPTDMSVFSYKGDIDTTMTPMDSIKYYKRFLRASFVAIEPQTGNVRAWVGGPNFTHFKYDQVYQGKRQVGSTFKPFLYTLAMQEGMKPCDQAPNIPVTFDLGNGEPWSPKNATAKYLEPYNGKMVTLKFGLAHSINNISAYLMKQFSPQAVVDLAHKMGIHSPLDPVVSICLGPSDITLLEMVSSYGTFVNKGVHVEPITVLRIEDKHGNTLANFAPQKNEAINDQTAYVMIEMLKGVVSKGTAAKLTYQYKVPGDVAGKTGTTNNNSDGWFIGITPRLVAGAWVGGEERSIHLTNRGEGAAVAMPIFANFINKVYADPKIPLKPTLAFEKPAIMPDVTFDCTNTPQENDVKGDDDDFFQ
jgi:penicillin-binding protein 1A